MDLKYYNLVYTLNTDVAGAGSLYDGGPIQDYETETDYTRNPLAPSTFGTGWNSLETQIRWRRERVAEEIIRLAHNRGNADQTVYLQRKLGQLLDFGRRRDRCHVLCGSEIQ
jgi:hypothetical protein